MLPPRGPPNGLLVPTGKPNGLVLGGSLGTSKGLLVLVLIPKGLDPKGPEVYFFT